MKTIGKHQKQQETNHHLSEQFGVASLLRPPDPSRNVSDRLTCE